MYGVSCYYSLMHPSMFALVMVGCTRLAVRRNLLLVKYEICSKEHVFFLFMSYHRIRKLLQKIKTKNCLKQIKVDTVVQ